MDWKTNLIHLTQNVNRISNVHDIFGPFAHSVSTGCERMFRIPNTSIFTFITTPTRNGRFCSTLHIRKPGGNRIRMLSIGLPPALPGMKSCFFPWLLRWIPKNKRNSLPWLVKKMFAYVGRFAGFNRNLPRIFFYIFRRNKKNWFFRIFRLHGCH